MPASMRTPTTKAISIKMNKPENRLGNWAKK
jgi:hypothetical protein